MIRDRKGWPCIIVGRDDAPCDGIVRVSVLGPDGSSFEEWCFASTLSADGGHEEIARASLAAEVIRERDDVPTYDAPYDSLVWSLLRSAIHQRPLYSRHR